MAKYEVIPLKLGKNHSLVGLDSLESGVHNKLITGLVIYIYRSTKTHQVYIGQTKQFIQRNSEHYNDKEEKFNQAEFDEVVVLYSQLFNGTALDDVEGQLITYFNSDVGKHHTAKKTAKLVGYETESVINRTGGNSVNDYIEREDVATQVILPFWEKYLYPHGWVSTPTLAELRTKALVKYSPIKSLTDQQEQIIQEIMDESSTSFVINGDAGTGKTVLLTNLVARLITKKPDLRIAVVVQPNWIKTAKEIFGVFGLNQSNLTIATSTEVINQNQPFDLVIVDEAHKLSRSGNKQMASFNKVYKNPKYAKAQDHLQILTQIGKRVVLMYDVLQAIRPANIPREQFKQDTKGFKRLYLKTQFRIQADAHSAYTSDDYINGIKYLLYKDTGLLESEETNYDPNFNRGVFREKGSDAYFGYFEDRPLHHMVDWLDHDQNLNPEHINRILGGLVEPWTIKEGKDPDKKQWVEGDIQRRWNSTQENWINSTDSDAKEQIGSVFAVQGIDLNKVGVLIGNDLQVDKQGRLYAERKNFHNVNGTFSKEEAEVPENKKEFTLFVLNIYYVLLTRGIDGVRVGFWHNENLLGYFKSVLLSD